MDYNAVTAEGMREREQFTRSSGTREKSTGARKSKNVQVAVQRTGPLKPTSTTDSK